LGQPFGLIFNGQEIPEALEDWANRLSQSVGKELALYAINNPEELRAHLYFTLLYTL